MDSNELNDYVAQRFFQAIELQETGRLEEALQLFRELEPEYRQSGDLTALGACIGNQAAVLQQLGRLDEAVSLHREDERICRQTGNEHGLIACFANQASIARRRGQLDDALALFSEQEVLCRKLNERIGLAACLSERALIVEHRGDLQGAMDLLKEGEAVFREMGAVGYLATCLGNQAGILIRQRNLDGASALLHEQEELARRFDDPIELQRCLGNQAIVFEHRGELTRAIALLTEQESICRRVGDPDGLHRALGNQAVILKQQGLFDRALALHEEEEGLCRDLHDLAGLAPCLGNQAEIRRQLGQLDEAMALLQEEESLCQQLGDPFQLQACWGAQAAVLLQQGALDAAQTLLSRKEELCRLVDDLPGLHVSLGNQAVIARHRGDLDRAMALHREEEHICRQIGDLPGLAASLGNQAMILRRRGELSTASILLAKVEEISLRTDAMSLALCHASKGLLMEQQGALDQAEALFNQSEAEFRRLDMPAEREIVLANLCRVHELKGQHERAKEIALEAIDLLEARVPRLYNYRAQVEALAEKADAYSILIRSCLTLAELAHDREQKNHFEEEAWKTANRRIGRLIMGYLAHRDPDLAQLQDARSALQSPFSPTRPGNPNPSGERIGLQAWEAALDRQEFKHIQATDPDRRRLLKVAMPNLSAVQSELRRVPGGAIMLQLLTLDQEVVAFILDGHELLVRRCSSSTNVRLVSRTHALLEALGRAVAAAPDDASRAWMDVEHSLSEGLSELAEELAPALECLPLGRQNDDNNVPHLLLVPSGLLHFWPLWAMSCAQGGWLLDYFACGVLPTADSLVALAEQRPRLGQYQGFAPPADPPRPFIVPQVRFEANFLDGDALIDSRATLDAFVSIKGGVVSLKGHCSIDLAQPDHSALQLADAHTGQAIQVTARQFLDGFWGTERVCLIALWACSLHGVLPDEGENWTGLTRSFLLATRTLLATLWPIDDLTALLLSVPFWEAVREGLTVPQALRQAVRSVRDAQLERLNEWTALVERTLDESERLDFERALVPYREAWRGLGFQDSYMHPIAGLYRLAPFLIVGWPGRVPLNTFGPATRTEKD